MVRPAGRVTSAVTSRMVLNPRPEPASKVISPVSAPRWLLLDSFRVPFLIVVPPENELLALPIVTTPVPSLIRVIGESDSLPHSGLGFEASVILPAIVLLTSPIPNVTEPRLVTSVTGFQ